MNSALEQLLRRERLVAGASLALLCLLAWIYLVSGAGLGHVPWSTPGNLSAHESAMQAMGMAASEQEGATGAYSWTEAILAISMWWTMMVAMMTPSAAPTILLYQRVRSHAEGSGSSGLPPTGMFALGYLLVWLGFSIAAAALQIGLQKAALLTSESLASQSAGLSGAVLIAAGAYQLSPLRKLCLGQCRSPAAFLSRHWRPGARGALRLGAIHGAYCVGCCWLLMALLFVGGVMNLALIAALTLLVMFEKLLPIGARIGRIAAVIFIFLGAATILVHAATLGGPLGR